MEFGKQMHQLSLVQSGMVDDIDSCNTVPVTVQGWTVEYFVFRAENWKSVIGRFGNNDVRVCRNGQASCKTSHARNRSIMLNHVLQNIRSRMTIGQLCTTTQGFGGVQVNQSRYDTPTC